MKRPLLPFLAGVNLASKVYGGPSTNHMYVAGRNCRIIRDIIPPSSGCLAWLVNSMLENGFNTLSAESCFGSMSSLVQCPGWKHKKHPGHNAGRWRFKCPPDTQRVRATDAVVQWRHHIPHSTVVAGQWSSKVHTIELLTGHLAKILFEFYRAKVSHFTSRKRRLHFHNWAIAGLSNLRNMPNESSCG